jgi:16S rRNA processing protein RimM
VRLVVARVGKAHGLRGEVTVEVRTDVPDRRFVPGAVLAVGGDATGRAERPAGSPAALTLASVRDHNGTLLLGFAEVTDRSAAEALRGAVLEAEVPDDPAEDDEPDAWFDHQLVGLRVVDPSGAELGQVTGLEHPPAQDLLLVRTRDGAVRRVPFVTALVPEVDVPGGRVVVDAPPGLLDDAPEA